MALAGREAGGSGGGGDRQNPLPMSGWLHLHGTCPVAASPLGAPDKLWLIPATPSSPMAPMLLRPFCCCCSCCWLLLRRMLMSAAYIMPAGASGLVPASLGWLLPCVGMH